MCVGIASVARKGVNYLQGAVGSVLEGLTAAEREDLYLIVFIAHSDPAEHPAYMEPWLHNLADKVLVYDPDLVDIEHIRSLETPEAKKFAREKGLFDHTYLLKACEALNTSYTVILEDDVVALDGWYHRTKQALDVAERKAEEEGVDQWLYLRLFYTEIFLGWNSEEWPTYLFFSLLTAAVVVITTTAIRYCKETVVKAQDAYPDYERDEDEKEIAENDVKIADYIHNSLASHLPETASTRETSHEVNLSDNASHKLIFDLLFPGIITNAKMWNIFEDELQENLNAAKTDQNTTSQEVQRSFIMQLSSAESRLRSKCEIQVWSHTLDERHGTSTGRGGSGVTQIAED
ncbi:CAZyme family GT109 [Aspergillus niger]|nr:CAZyme family GT109 [Aspergillus niger]KAI2960610.1 CAZyme family GT109 [Aspergillus niger]KAI3031736.1 CAZyme family GT109 [Aspergillus niger]